MEHEAQKINPKYSQDDVLVGVGALNQKVSGEYSKLQSNGCHSPKAQIFHMVPFFDGNSETIPAKVLDSSFDVIHSEDLKLGKVGKGKNGNGIQVYHRLTRNRILNTTR